MKGLQIKSLLKKVRESGFTLIEMAVVLVVVGIIVSIMATALPLLLQSAKLRQARAEVEKIDYSLEGYLISNGKFPCPDTDGNGLENRVPGTDPLPLDDTCTAYVGEIPYLTLGLSTARDPWQNVMRYGVYEDLIRSTGGSGSTSFCNVIKSVPSTPQPPVVPTKIYTTIGATNTYQAYIIVSGGSMDRDNVGGFFDGLNGDGTLLQFEDAGRLPPTAANYDDIVKAASFPFLAGKECAGTETGGVPGGEGENTYFKGCVDGFDNDGDDLTDCADPDCLNDYYCTSSPQVTITAATLPTGSINSLYSATISATGGTPSYSWELLDKDIDNNGTNDLAINPYTGVITGTLNVCPGTYTNAINVKVTDSTTPLPAKTDTQTFSLTVNPALTISGRGTISPWSNPDWQEPYSANNRLIATPLANITWELTPTGSGFTAAQAETDSCVIKKNTVTTVPPYTYNFTLKATDPACSTNIATKSVDITLTDVGALAPIMPTASAWWKFDECGWDTSVATYEVKDSALNPRDGTAIDGANTVPGGKICQGGQFDGNNDQVSIPDATKLDLPSPFSISLWIWLPSTVVPNTQNIIAKGANYAVLYLKNGTVRFTTSGTSATTTAVPTRGAWHHIVAAFTANTAVLPLDRDIKLYIDGSLSAWANDNEAATININALLIGGIWDDAYPHYIDEVSIFDKELNANEVSALYNGGYGLARACPCP